MIQRISLSSVEFNGCCLPSLISFVLRVFDHAVKLFDIISISLRTIISVQPIFAIMGIFVEAGQYMHGIHIFYCMYCIAL